MWFAPGVCDTTLKGTAASFFDGMAVFRVGNVSQAGYAFSIPIAL